MCLKWTFSFPDLNMLLLQPSPSHRITAVSSGNLGQNVRGHYCLLSLSLTLTSNPPVSSLGSFFKIQLETDQFSPLPLLPPWTKPPSLYGFFKKRFYLLIFREKGREEERKREKNINLLLLICAPTATEPEARACALTRNRTDGLLICGGVPIPLSHALGVLSTPWGLWEPPPWSPMFAMVSLLALLNTAARIIIQ